MTSRYWVVLTAVVAMALPSLAAAGPQEQAMAKYIAQQVTGSGQLSNYRLGVEYQDGVAVLMGTVTDAKQAQIAMSLASQVEGVERVVNNLEIAPAKPNAPQPRTKQVKPAAVKSGPEETSGGLLMSLSAARTPEPPAPQGMPQQASQQPQRISQVSGQQPQPYRTSAAPMPFAPSRMPGVQPVAYRQGMVQQAQCSGCYGGGAGAGGGGYVAGAEGGGGYESANMPGYAWPSYAAHPNYAAVTYPKQYSPTAWPYIGPFYPYPQVPLGWRNVTLEWDDGWWF
ncbi:MAG: BON domain-containing protein, partial [Planctomycetales bacterium]|nr:BON domain-containing protein [Planctomycetales bacterium]